MIATGDDSVGRTVRRGVVDADVASPEVASPEVADPEVASAGAAFAAVYTAEHDPLVRLAALVTGSTIVAEDLVQEAFAKLHPRFARIDNPPAWLRTVVLNGARNELRRAGLRRRLVERTPRAAGTHVDAPVNELIDSLRRLPARQRAVVVLRYYEDRPEAEIAELLGMRLGTVKSSLHRAHTALRQELSHD